MPTPNFSDILQFCNLPQEQIKNKRVFIRSDLNVPLDESGNITDDTRIKAAIPCIKYAIDNHAIVMITSHLGRPTEGQFKPSDSLKNVAQHLGQLLGQHVELVSNWLNDSAISTLNNLQPQQVVLLENCRLNIGEKSNNNDLGQKMAALCDIFVHDAFGTAHRAEASTNAIAKYTKTSCAGPLLCAELKALDAALHKPNKPIIAIVGGSKVSSKLSVLSSLADKVDNLIVGGGIANTFLLASGKRIGKSLCEIDLIDSAKNIIQKMHQRGASIPIPTDVVVAKEFSSNAIATIKSVDDIDEDDLILDIGPNSAQNLTSIIAQAQTIVWNGPVGVFEFEAFSHGTRAIATAISNSQAFSIAGGGDTLAAIAKFKITQNISYISTGGGAFLEFLEGKILPIFDVLIKK